MIPDEKGHHKSTKDALVLLEIQVSRAFFQLNLFFRQSAYFLSQNKGSFRLFFPYPLYIHTRTTYYVYIKTYCGLKRHLGLRQGTISVPKRQNPFLLHLVKLRNRALKFLVHFSLVCLGKYPKPHEK